MKLLKVSTSIVLLCASTQSLAQSPAPDYFIANCFNCHGTNGRGHSAIPPLAGLSKSYIIEQINAFKSGTRSATVMQQLAKAYTDDEIARAAEYFSKQKK